MSARRWIALAVLAAVAIACFLWGDGASAAERRLFVAIGGFGTAHAGPALAMTALGYFIVLGPLSLILAVRLAMRRGTRVAWVYLAGTLIARLGVEAVKDLARRPRPALLPHLAPAFSWSFPSGHAANSMAVLLGFGLLVSHNKSPPVRVERSRDTAPARACLDFARHEQWYRVIGAILAIAVGASRVFLAVHWPSDVLAGWALGATAAILTAAAAEAISPSRS